MENRFVKGYLNDAGTDIILLDDVTFKANDTTHVDLECKITPEPGTFAVLMSRTSAAIKGLCVAVCPIDADYCGNVSAIVHNISNNTIHYKAGEAFCQVVFLPLAKPTIEPTIKKEGRRNRGKFGSTGI